MQNQQLFLTARLQNAAWRRRAHAAWLPVSVFSDPTSGGDFQGGATEASGCPGRQLEGEDGLYLPEADCASLHDSEGLFHVLGSPETVCVQCAEPSSTNIPACSLLLSCRKVGVFAEAGASSLNADVHVTACTSDKMNIGSKKC